MSSHQMVNDELNDIQSKSIGAAAADDDDNDDSFIHSFIHSFRPFL